MCSRGKVCFSRAAFVGRLRYVIPPARCQFLCPVPAEFLTTSFCNGEMQYTSARMSTNGVCCYSLEAD